MNLWSRLMSTWQGARAGWTGRVSTMIPQRDVPYKVDPAARLAYYDAALAYYNNTIYDSLQAYGELLKAEERLYRFIRSIFNPVKQENDLLVSYTYRGTLDTETLTGGCLPLKFDNKRLEEPLRQVMKWSNLNTQLAPFVRDAALYGDTAWWVIDDPLRRRVRLELIDPGRIKYVVRDEVGNVKSVVLEWKEDEQPDVARYRLGANGELGLQKTKTYTKTLIVDQEWFETYKDGKPFAYYTDEDGAPVTRWPNIYQFVPLTIGHFAPGKDGWGQNSFFGTARRQIDEINDQYSLINDIIRNAVAAPKLQAIGLSKSDKIEIQRTDRDDMIILYIPNKEGKLEPIKIDVDIASASANRDKMIAECQKSMPILALQTIRDVMGSGMSGVAIENAYGDATSVIEKTRTNLDPVLVAALQMAVSIGAIQGYDGFSGFNENSYDNGEMELSVVERAVIEDRLSKGEKVDKLTSIANLPPGSKRKALAEMGYGEQEIEEIVAADEEQQEAETRAAVRGLADSVFGDDDEEETDNGTDTEADPETDEEDARTPVGIRQAAVGD